MSILSAAQVDEAGLADWRLLRQRLQTRYRTGSWATGIALVNAISSVAEEANHHPDVDLRYGHLNVRLQSHDVGGVTGRDVRMARKITGLAQDAGVTADPSALAVVELGLDTPEMERVRPFWTAVLGGQQGADSDEVRNDAADVVPLWFQPSGSEEPRQRFHLDVSLPPEQVEERLKAAVAAGGTVVSREQEPAFIVLADPDGNKVCLCTSLGRDGG